MGRFLGALGCLAFAIPFGGVGVFASWAIGATLVNAWEARDWVRVRATVESAALQESRGTKGSTTYRAEGRYVYVVDGKRYEGKRLGVGAMGGSDNVDDWHHEVSAALEEAKATGRALTVWVNPDNPAESVFDREIRWSELLFLVPFSLAFGGVGVGALWVMVNILRGKGGEAGSVRDGDEGATARALGAMGDGSGQRSTPAFLWVFAFFWNALSFPIALVAIPDIVAERNWPGLLVLLFPLVGLGLLWGAVAATWSAWKSRRDGRPAPGAGARRTVPGTMAAQAARAMFEPGRSGVTKPADVAIPAAIAEVAQEGDTLVIRYARRRRLGVAAFALVFGAGASFAAVAIIAADGFGVGVAALLAIGTLLDLSAAGLVVAGHVVRANRREIVIERTGLTGRREARLRPEEVRAIRPVTSYAINNEPYFSIVAEAGESRQESLGSSVKGEEVATSLARRIARAAGLPESRVLAPQRDPAIAGQEG